MEKVIETVPHTHKRGDVHTEPYTFIVKYPINSPRHWQAEIEGIYVETGWLDINVQEEVYHIEAGGFVFIAEGMIHSFLEKAEGGIVHVLKFLNEHVIKHGFGNNTKVNIAQLYKSFFIANSMPEMEMIIKDIHNADFGVYNECYICGKLAELTAFFLKYPELITVQRNGNEDDNANSLQSVFDFVHAHIDESISLERLANHLGFSTFYCSRYIKKKTGMTFVEYVNATRVAEAETLLLETNNNITEITYKAGFSSMQTFNRVFKQIKSISPSEYRKKRKGTIKYDV